jgi:DNA ligase-1
MLAHPTKSISEVLDRFEGITFTCEYKYDGERAQIHKLEDGSCRIYSRNSENMSEKYPDIIDIVNEHVCGVYHESAPIFNVSSLVSITQLIRP